jgi:FkbM family methyltransferase
MSTILHSIKRNEKLWILIKTLLFPVYSIFTNKIGWCFFYINKGQWKLYTKGRFFPSGPPRLHSLDYFRRFLPTQGGIVLDVGGEYGFEAKQFSELVGDSGKVYTFECFPSHIEHLRKMSEEYHNIQIIEEACWNEPTKLTFHIGNTVGSNTAVPDVKGQFDQKLASNKTIEVKANTLDMQWKIYCNSEEIDFLKMDIEGAEYEAIEGAKEVLLNTKKVVIASYHIRDGVPTASKVADMLRELNFQVHIDENLHVYGTR